MAGVPIQIKRGTRAQLDAAATAGELRVGEPYLITDEDRVALGLSATTYQSYAKDTGDRLKGTYEFYESDNVTWSATIDATGIYSGGDVSVFNNYSLTFGDGTSYLYGYDDGATLAVGWQLEIKSNNNADGYGDLILDSGGSRITSRAAGGIEFSDHPSAEGKDMATLDRLRTTQIQASGIQKLDFLQHNVYEIEVTGDCHFTLADLLPTHRAAGYLILTNGGSYNISFVDNFVPTSAWDGQLAVAYDLTTATYDGFGKDVTAQTTTPYGFTGSPDGSKLFIAGYSENTIYSYSMGTPFDTLLATYSGDSLDLTAQGWDVASIAPSPDGTKMFVADYAGSYIRQIDMATPWDITTATPQSSDFFVMEGNPRDVDFRMDGTKMYILGDASDYDVFQYTLSTPWDLSTATYDGVSLTVGGSGFFGSVVEQDETPQGICFSNGGDLMFMIGSGDDNIYRYSLTTPWDLSTCSYTGTSFNVGNVDGTPRDIGFSPDASHLYVVGSGNGRVYRYKLQTKDMFMLTQFGPSTMLATPMGRF